MFLAMIWISLRSGFVTVSGRWDIAKIIHNDGRQQFVQSSVVFSISTILSNCCWMGHCWHSWRTMFVAGQLAFCSHCHPCHLKLCVHCPSKLSAMTLSAILFPHSVQKKKQCILFLSLLRILILQLCRQCIINCISATMNVLFHFFKKGNIRPCTPTQGLFFTGDSYLSKVIQ